MRIRAVGKDRRPPAVELALAMPALCLFIFGIIEVDTAVGAERARLFGRNGSALRQPK